MRVGLADDLADFEAAAGETAAPASGQWSRPSPRNPRGPAELAPQHHRHVLVQPAVVQVGDQGVESPVELRQLRPCREKLFSCVSQSPTLSVTTDTPASTSRRAIRKFSQNLPYRSCGSCGSWDRSKASRAFGERDHLDGLLRERVHAVKGARAIDLAAQFRSSWPNELPAIVRAGRASRLLLPQVRQPAPLGTNGRWAAPV